MEAYMGVLKQVYAVQYYVKDWERAKTFYGKTLALPSLGADDNVGWAEFGDKEQTHVAISRWRDDGKPMPVNGAFAIFSVDDAHAAVKELRARGVKCDDPIPIPEMVTYADFYDPEGNRLELAGPPPKK
jgi:predicted enzyme related to lactoylglutathione lyase